MRRTTLEAKFKEEFNEIINTAGTKLCGIARNAFIDLEKSFDRVKREEIRNVLEDSGMEK